MNRIIKFRIWSPEQKRFITDLYETFGKDLNEIFVNINDFSKCIVQQYTGLKDKHGREIYEGDIIIFMGRWDEKGNVLKPDYRKYEVVWFMGGFQAIIKTLKAFHSHNECLGVGHTDSEILGNILENPELIKK